MGTGAISKESRAEVPLRQMDGTPERLTRVETRIHQRQCTRCQRWFWAWDTAREQCFVCDAPPPTALRAILEQIHGARV